MGVRITEAELAIPALRVAAAKPGGFIPTSDLIAELEGLLAPEGEDQEKLEGRNDTKFSQKVRNLVSHKGTPKSIFSRGYAVHEKRRPENHRCGKGVFRSGA